MPGPATQFLRELGDEPVAVSLFAVCELQAGAFRADHPLAEMAKIRRILDRIDLVCPDERLPSIYGRIDAQLKSAGRGISTMDLLIAATALANGSAVVTRNHREFTRVPGLEVLGY